MFFIVAKKLNAILQPCLILLSGTLSRPQEVGYRLMTLDICSPLLNAPALSIIAFNSYANIILLSVLNPFI